MKHVAALAALLAATTAAAQDAPDPARLKADVETLAGFGTRHSLSSPDDPRRGIGAARRWAAGELTRISDACDGCITSANLARTFVGPRAPSGVEVIDILGFQQGVAPRRMVVIAAHVDTRAADVLDMASDSPGANSDAAGVALVLEAARLLSRRKFDATIVYALFSGTAQDHTGAKLLADTARQNKWTVTALFDNDAVGAPADPARVSVVAGDGAAAALAATIAKDASDPAIEVRSDAPGDHQPFASLGYPAIGFTARRIGDPELFGAADSIARIDFAYLARLSALEASIAGRLAGAAPDPKQP